jgi:putative SOS response-associated peptidase YedK
MCGRIALYTPPHRLARFLEATLAAGLDPHLAASWNVAPTDSLFGVTDRGSGRVLDAYRWGLVPSFAKNTSGASRLINARAESVATKPSFRDAFRRHRLLVPVDGFYEWDRRGTTKVPHYFTRSDGAPMVLAGLYEHWRDATDRDAGWLTTCTVVTTTTGPDLDGIHDRMPVVLESDVHDLWLTAGDDEEEAALLALCTPARKGTLEHHPVGSAVGNVANNCPELIDSVASSGGEPSEQRLFEA